MSIIDAIEDVKTELRAGRTPDFTGIAADYGLRELVLVNRAKLALGDLSTWATRDADLKARMQASQASTEQRRVEEDRKARERAAREAQLLREYIASKSGAEQAFLRSAMRGII